MGEIQEVPTAFLFGDVFIYHSIDKRSECILRKENGQKCGIKLNTHRPYNLKRHVKHLHPDFTTKIIMNKCQLNLSSTYVLNCCVEMLTINGRPFTLLSDSGFLKLINPFLDYIEQNSGEKISIKVDKVKEQLRLISGRIREQITKETENTLVSVMIDIATRCNRAFLCVNLQCMLNGRIVIRTLKMLHLTESHTGKSLAAAVVNTLKEFGISIIQVYSQTTDNAANVVLSSKILDKLAEAEKNSRNENEMTIEEIEDAFYMELLKEAEREFFRDKVVAENVVKLSCGEHTFQLAFNDALAKTTEATELIQKVRNVAKKLRTPNILNALREKNLNFPLIANDTRWTGNFTMVSNTFYAAYFTAYSKELLSLNSKIIR